jgi:hypothetical protein
MSTPGTLDSPDFLNTKQLAEAKRRSILNFPMQANAAKILRIARSAPPDEAALRSVNGMAGH